MPLSVVNYKEIIQDRWILDSRSGRHLACDERMLEKSRDCDNECLLPDGQSLRVMKVRSVLLQVTPLVDLAQCA